MNSNIWLILICLFPSIENQIVLKVNLFDFFITDRDSFKGKQCSSSVKCYKIFHVCLSDTLRKKCEIQNKTVTFENQNKISNVFNSTIDLVKVPEWFLIDVKFTDVYGTSNDTNLFNTSLNPVLNHPNLGFLTPKSDMINAEFQYKFKFSCQIRYGGDNCQPLCKNEPNIYDCLLNQCQSKCKNGACIVNKTALFSKCQCNTGWQGEFCSQNLLPCDYSICTEDKLVCRDEYCTCQTSDFTNFKCKRKQEFNEKSSNINQSYITFYALISIPIVLAFMGLVGFISVSLWRYYYYYSIPRVSSPLFQNVEDIENEFSPYVTCKMSAPEYSQSVQASQPENSDAIILHNM